MTPVTPAYLKASGAPAPTRSVYPKAASRWFTVTTTASAK